MPTLPLLSWRALRRPRVRQRVAPGLSLGTSLGPPRKRLAALLIVAVLGLVGATCGPRNLTAPFLDITVSAIPITTTQLQVDASLGGKTRTESASGGSFGRFTVSLPEEARGRIDLQATARDAGGCIVALGQLSIELIANEVYARTLTLAAKQPPLCAAAGMLPVTLNKVGGGGGVISATPSALTCDTACPSKMVQLDTGTVITLSVDSLASGPGWSSTFDGWTGDCSGTGSCMITLSQATTVTARFTCHGWCPETMPGETTNLNAVWGFASNRVVAVGDGGRILQWNGMTWQRINSPVTASLRGLHGITGGIGYAVGDAGTILKTTSSGDSWSVMTSTTTANLRGVWAAEVAAIYAVGDPIGTSNPWLASDGTTWAAVNRSNSNFAWNAVWGADSLNYFTAGNAGKSVRYNPYANLPDAATDLYGLYGNTISTMTAVGRGSTLLRYNPTGPGWTPMTKPGGTGIVVLRAIHGASDNAMFAVGDSGTVWFFDGTSWTVETFPVASQLNDVYVVSSSELYVVGDGGLIYHKKP